MKILVMGLPGSGKTYLAERLVSLLDAAWINADRVRNMVNDWDFTAIYIVCHSHSIVAGGFPDISYTTLETL